MIPARHDIEHTRGDTLEIFGRVRDRVWNETLEIYEPGSYKNITGWVGLCHVRVNKDDPDPLFSITIELGNQATTPGSFFMRLAPAVTAGISMTGDFITAKYDLQWTTPANEVFTYLEGNFKLKKDTTR